LTTYQQNKLRIKEALKIDIKLNTSPKIEENYEPQPKVSSDFQEFLENRQFEPQNTT